MVYLEDYGITENDWREIWQRKRWRDWKRFWKFLADVSRGFWIVPALLLGIVCVIHISGRLYREL